MRLESKLCVRFDSNEYSRSRCYLFESIWQKEVLRELVIIVHEAIKHCSPRKQTDRKQNQILFEKAHANPRQTRAKQAAKRILQMECEQFERVVLLVHRHVHKRLELVWQIDARHVNRAFFADR